MESYKVSIVIPVYNTPPNYLEAAVASALSQTMEGKEVIVVNDGSTREDTLLLLGELERQGNVRVLHQANQGPAGARNAGIAIANGKYILPLDADDLFEPTYAEKAYALMEDNPNLGIVYCQADLFGAKTGRWELLAYRFPRFLLGNCIFCSAMFRKSDWTRVGGYNLEMTLGWEDYEFFLSLVELGVGVRCMPEVLFHYRQHASVSRNTKMEDKPNRMRVWEQIMRFHRQIFVKHLWYLRKHRAEVYDVWKLQTHGWRRVREFLFGV